MMRGSAVPTTVWSSASSSRVSIKAPSTLKSANLRRRRLYSGPACFCDTDDVSIAFSLIAFFLLRSKLYFFFAQLFCPFKLQFPYIDRMLQHIDNILDAIHIQAGIAMRLFRRCLAQFFHFSSFHHHIFYLGLQV